MQAQIEFLMFSSVLACYSGCEVFWTPFWLSPDGIVEFWAVLFALVDFGAEPGGPEGRRPDWVLVRFPLGFGQLCRIPGFRCHSDRDIISGNLPLSEVPPSEYSDGVQQEFLREPRGFERAACCKPQARQGTVADTIVFCFFEAGSSSHFEYSAAPGQA